MTARDITPVNLFLTMIQQFIFSNTDSLIECYQAKESGKGMRDLRSKNRYPENRELAPFYSVKERKQAKTSTCINGKYGLYVGVSSSLSPESMVVVSIKLKVPNF